MIASDLVEQYKVRFRSDVKRGRQYLAVIEKFGLHVTEIPTKEDVEARLAELRKAGYADGTIDWEFRVIRSFFRANDLQWPYRRGEGPKIREREVVALGLDDDLICRMVQVARRGRVSVLDTAYLALSTLYGMRRAELAELTPEEFDLPNRLIYIEAKKHGRQRYHVIPEAVLPVLEAALPYLTRKEPIALTKCFYRVEKAAGLQHTAELGWHGIRRMLDRRLLQAGLDEFTVANFLRWKRSGTNMAARYFNLTVVSAKDSGIAQDTGDKEVDDAVFAKHPFLPFWEGEHGA